MSNPTQKFAPKKGLEGKDFKNADASGDLVMQILQEMSDPKGRTHISFEIDSGNGTIGTTTCRLEQVTSWDFITKPGQKIKSATFFNLDE